MYPGSIFTWHDNSAIRNTVVNTVDNSPLYLHVSSFDRGPEELIEVSGKTFYDLFGTKMNFAKHGQPALQAANMIDGGARLLIKRLVADDAKLANLVAVAKVKSQITATENDGPQAKTIDEIIGRDPVPKTYATVLNFSSKVGSTNNSTILYDINPALDAGNSYYILATDDERLPEKDTEITSEYVAWDGTSDIAIADGTHIKLVETDVDGKIQKCGIITVTSKIPHDAQSPIAPTTSITPIASGTIEESATVGSTKITISGTIGTGNEYFYAVEGMMPEQDQTFTPAEITADWIAFGTGINIAEIATDEGKEIVVVEFAADPSASGDLIAVKGCSFNAVVNPGPDTRTSSSTEPISGEKKYIVNPGDRINTIQWHTSAIDNCMTKEEVEEGAKRLFVIEEPVINTIPSGATITLSADYPLIIMSDNGRGLSNKSFKIAPDYTTSKDMNNMFYNVYIFDGTTAIEKCVGTLNPGALYGDTLYGLNEDTSIQVKFANLDGAYDAFIENICDLKIESDNVPITAANVNKFDFINVTNSKGAPIGDGLTLDPESENLNSAYGINLAMGSNGSFSDAPFGTDEWIEQAVAVFDGTYDDSIWDVDTYKIAAIFDANYPDAVKTSIAKFVTFREDCVYFRDYGVGINSYSEIKEYHDNKIEAAYKNKFIADYYTTYQIFDPETKKRIRVTMMYDFANVMVKHFANGCYRPLAGTANNMILASAIDGTINFTPRITPSKNQKALLDDARINYAIFESGVCVVQSTYSSQSEFTQLSFINNVLAIEEVVRAVRTACPKQRYTFTTGSDFSTYAAAVNNVLNSFRDNFAELRFEYEQDTIKAAQKIFYASIYFRFNNWAQTESFELYALPNE